MILYLVRHGETESNRKGLALGRADVPLNETGIDQAQRLAERFSNEPLAAVYSSPLQRARVTAEAIAGTQGLPVKLSPGLVEMDIGHLDGLTFPEIRERYPDLMKQWASPEGQASAVFGSEGLADVRDRGWRTLESLARRHSADTVCAVTHNFVILSVLTRAVGIELSNFRRLRHAVAAISVIEFGAARIRVRRMNDTCHLAAD